MPEHYAKSELAGQEQSRSINKVEGVDTLLLKIIVVDHIIPQAKGGTDHEANLQLLCNHCNLVKSTGTQTEL